MFDIVYEDSITAFREKNGSHRYEFVNMVYRTMKKGEEFIC